MSRTVHLIGVPMDLGQARRGVDMGPSAIRYAGAADRLRQIGCEVVDMGDLAIPSRELVPGTSQERFVLPVQAACQAAYDAGRCAVEEGAVPIFLGGDHSMAIGTVGGVSHGEPLGLLWIDAHGDFNLPRTSPNGNIHGMPVSVLLGEGYPELVDLGRPGPKIRPEHTVMLGIRNLDYDERSLLAASGIRIYTMSEIDERGLGPVAREALQRLTGVGRLHVSLDMDAIDPSEAPGVGTPCQGGLTFREAHLLMEVLAATGSVASIDIAEINPILDDRNRTALTAVDLLTSLLGQTIL